MGHYRVESHRRNQPVRSVFERQGSHVVLLAILITATLSVAYSFDGFLDGEWLGLQTEAWMYGALVLSVMHQLWVWFWWRMEYHLGWCSRTFGPSAFRIYATGFAILAFVRIFTVIGLGVANYASAPIPRTVAWALSGLLVPPVVWLIYSLARYFGFVHAVGGDHFFEEHRNRDLCREGIFRYIPNAACASKAALLLSAFNHAYIRVHFYCTEKPDMRRIYGS